ncbi:MAG TPA: DUF6585 family protein, partial [Ktedonobacteraceae bacterium]|nr:DUF6585 family protein [Ktedonobacteraceae bacterium]
DTPIAVYQQASRKIQQSVLCAAGVLLTWWSYTYTPPFWIVLFIVGSIVASVSLTNLIKLPFFNVRVYVYRDGLLSVQFGHSDELRWEQVASIRRWTRKVTSSRYNSLTHTSVQKIVVHPAYVVEGHDGTTLEFDTQILRFQDLGRTIEAETVRYLLPPAVAAYEAGRTVQFGPLSINQHGIRHGERELPWSTFEHVDIDEDGMISFRYEGQWQDWSRVALDEVPNVHIFEALVCRVKDIPDDDVHEPQSSRQKRLVYFDV